MNDIGFINEIRELAGVWFVKSPLYTDNDQYDQEGCVAVDFQHGLLVLFHPEDK